MTELDHGGTVAIAIDEGRINEVREYVSHGSRGAVSFEDARALLTALDDARSMATTYAENCERGLNPDGTPREQAELAREERS